MGFQTVRPYECAFTIENNIIKGQDIPVSAVNNIGQQLLNILENNSKVVAEIDAETEEQLVFSIMAEKSKRCALWLRKQNIKKGNVVSICTHKQMGYYIPVLATFYESAIFNAWSEEITLGEARYFMNFVKPKIMFCCESIINTLIEAAKLENVKTKFIVFGKHDGIESIDDVLNSVAAKDVENYEPVKIDDIKNDVAFITFSSGTTGIPKGITHSYESLLNNVFFYNSFPVGVRKILSYSAPYWQTDLVFTMRSIIHGVTRIVHANFDPDVTSKIIEKFKIDLLFITPVMVGQYNKSDVITSKKYLLGSLKEIVTAGSITSSIVMENFQNSLPHVLIKNTFGMSEFGTDVLSKTPDCKITNSVGFIYPNFILKIIDEATGESIGPNNLGELCIKKNIMMMGYYKNPVALEGVIDDEGWFHTGDEAFFTENGEIVISSRIKDLMSYKDHRISPAEIENALIRHPDILEVAVVPVPHEIDIDRPMAFVRKTLGSKLTEEDIVTMSAELGEYKTLWGGVKFLDQLPKTPTGKIMKKELIRMAKAYTVELL